MKLPREIFLMLLVTLAPVAMSKGAGPLADRVILLANRDDPDSELIARHYAAVRGVPRENIIALSMPLSETITWTDFVDKIWQPVQDELIRRQWIDAIPMNLIDAVGRRKNAISGHRISYLVVCRGVPLRISHDPARFRPHPPATDNPFFQTNQAAVDSELSLLAVNESPINGFVQNPLFRNEHPAPWELAQVVKVSRLDGPTLEDALGLVDRAVAGERLGLNGRAYVDLGGIHPDGEIWLRTVASQIRELGFDMDVDESPATFPSSARFDAPVLYFGWYAPNLNGPFALPGFRFPPGAIAVHIHSGSAATLRSTVNGWCGPLVARGVTATVGNVFEPYLQLLHRPDLLLRSLARGDAFGDAAYYAVPALSWQAIAIGDPLYRPFARPFENQWANRANLTPRQAGYAALRKAHLLEEGKQAGEVLALLQGTVRERPALALAYALAARQELDGDSAGAALTLGSAVSLASFQPDEWVLAHDAAALLHRVGSARQALLVNEHLLQDSGLPAELRVPWLREGREVALEVGEADLAATWSRELSGLVVGQRK